MAAAAAEDAAEVNLNLARSIYKATRSIKKKRNSIYNALRSIYEDSIFVSEIAGIWPQLPLIANLRCGLWYSSRFESTCYFKSTDGHANNCSFSSARLNLHLAHLAGQRGGCIIVDSTRKGKRFPDSMSKTIPIWACVLNRAVARQLERLESKNKSGDELELTALSNNIAKNNLWDCSLHLPLWVLDTEKAAIEDRLEEWTNQLETCGADIGSLVSFLKKPLRPLWISQRTLIWLNEVPDYDSVGYRCPKGNYEMIAGPELTALSNNIAKNNLWDCSLHLPLWVLDTEKAAIEDRLEEWTNQLETCGADIGSLVSFLKKPLRPLWISQRTLIWLNEVPDYDSWDFTPIILVSASATSGMSQQRTTSEFSWHYIPGAGDDEESWARGLSPNLFWKHAYDIIDSGPDLCNQKVHEIIEKERVYLSQRSVVSPQVAVKPQKSLRSNDQSHSDSQLRICVPLCSPTNVKSFEDECYLSWIGATNIALGRTCHVENVSESVHCILNCESKSVSLRSQFADSYLHLPIVSSKLDRFSLMNSLPLAIDFAKLNLSMQRKLLICCHDGEDISVCVGLAIITALFDGRGSFDGGKSFADTSITKWDLRKRLVFVCKFAVNARPSRGNLRQVFGFLSREKESETAN